MVISVNQLSLYGAVADLIKEFPVDQRAPGKLVALEQMEQEFLTQLHLAEVQADEERQGNLLQDHERRFEKLPEDQKLSKLCSEAGRSWTILLCSSVTEWSEESIFFQRIHVTSKGKGNLRKRVDRKRCTIRPCLGHKS